MNIKIIRGGFLNPFELQNYYPLKDKYNISVVSSKYPISDKIALPLEKLWSPSDFPNIPYKYPILNRVFGDAQKLWGLEKALKGVDIAHVAETYFGYTYQAVIAKRRGGVKKVVSTVWETIPKNNEGLKGRRMHKILSRENIDHYIAVTERAKDSLIEEGVKSKKITVIPMGVDLKKFRPNEKYKNKRDINILCVARLVEEKGVLDLLNAFHSLRHHFSNLRLTFIGNGPLRSELVGFKNISVKNVPYHRMPFEYSQADIFCLPSKSNNTWEEQFGMSIVEAMASGLPIVSTKSGAIPEVCGQVAKLAYPGNDKNLESKLRELILDKAERHAMSQEGRKLAEKKYNHLDVSNSIDEIYQKVTCR